MSGDIKLSVGSNLARSLDAMILQKVRSLHFFWPLKRFDHRLIFDINGVIFQINNRTSPCDVFITTDPVRQFKTSHSRTTV